MEKIQKLNLRIQKLIFPGTHWRGLALIGSRKKPCVTQVLCHQYFLFCLLEARYLGEWGQIRHGWQSLCHKTYPENLN